MRKLRIGFVLLGVVLAFTLAFLWNTVVVSYGPDQQGVYWSRFFGGTTDQILQGGTSYKLPWDEIYIYDMRSLTTEETTSFISKDGVEMSVQWSGRFRPLSAKLPDLHNNIGPGYAETVVVPEIASTMRRILGNYPAEELLAYAESAFMEKVAADTLKLFPDSPIIVENILIHELLGPKG